MGRNIERLGDVEHAAALGRQCAGALGQILVFLSLSCIFCGMLKMRREVAAEGPGYIHKTKLLGIANHLTVSAFCMYIIVLLLRITD